MGESQEYIDICNELAGRVMPDIEYIALLNTKVGILQEENQRLREVLERVIAEGDIGFSIKSILGPDSDLEAHWSIPKELKADIEKYLAKTKSRPTIRTKKGQDS